MLRRFYHGTARAGWRPHIGACLTPSREAAESYADWRHGSVLSVWVDLTDLVIEDRSDEVDRDENWYPGDDAADRARLRAEGVDIVTYRDEDERGRPLICYRLISPAAVAAAETD